MLFRIFNNLDAVDASHPVKGNKSEHDFSLSGRPDTGKRSIDGAPLAACFLKNIEVPQQGHAIAIHIEDAAPHSAYSGIMTSVMALAELQSNAVPAVGNGHGVGEMSPPLAGV